MARNWRESDWICIVLVFLALLVGLALGAVVAWIVAGSTTTAGGGQQCPPCIVTTSSCGDPCGKATYATPAPDPDMGQIRGMSWREVGPPNSVPDPIEMAADGAAVTVTYVGSGFPDQGLPPESPLRHPMPAMTDAFGVYEVILHHDLYKHEGDHMPCFEVTIDPPSYPDPEDPSGTAIVPYTAAHGPSPYICPFVYPGSQAHHDFPLIP